MTMGKRPSGEQPAPPKQENRARDAGLEQNAVECLDRIEVYEGKDECPIDAGEHGYLSLHVSAVALGFDDDDEHYHHGRERWEYPVEM